MFASQYHIQENPNKSPFLTNETKLELEQDFNE